MSPKLINNPADIMTPPDYCEQLEEILDEVNIPWDITIENVQDLLDAEKVPAGNAQ